MMDTSLKRATCLVVMIAGLAIFPRTAAGKILHLTALQLVEMSHQIVLGEFLRAEDRRKYQITSRIGFGPRIQFADYRVERVLKGKDVGSIVRVNFQQTNAKYPPFTCRPPSTPEGGKTVLLFLEPDGILLHGSQGKIELEQSLNGPRFLAGIERMITIANADDGQKVKRLFLAYQTGDATLRTMAANSIVRLTDLKFQSAVPFLIAILNDRTASDALRGSASWNLGWFAGKEAHDALDKCVRRGYSVKKACSVAIADLNKRAIQPNMR